MTLNTRKKMEQHLMTLEDEAKFFGFKTKRSKGQLVISCEE